MRDSLELKGNLKSGRVGFEFLDNPLMPSAPLRAFSYTQAGGVKATGSAAQINAVFKCPDGYAGEWHFGKGADANKEHGYDEYESDGNPFSNKIILMDEVHNLVNPSPQIANNPVRLRCCLTRAHARIGTAQDRYSLSASISQADLTVWGHRCGQ